jgi:3',5'-cyclic AMP phosphodiesterase CpdA
MELKRRAFLKWGGLGLAAAGLNPEILWSSPGQIFYPRPAKTLLSGQLTDQEFPFPYDEFFFQCAERIYNVRPRGAGISGYKADLSLVLKAGKSLDVKILVAETLDGLSKTNDILSFTGVRDILDVELFGGDSRRLYYQVLYREGSAAWKALSAKSFKLPNANLTGGGEIKVLLISDDHTFDDADCPVPDTHKAIKLSGDYVNEFMKKLRSDPNFVPDKPLGALKNGLCLAQTLRYIMAYEDPDLIFNLGDTNGIGASYKWEKLGLPAPSPNLTERDYDTICRILWLRMRKMYSALTPWVPMYIAQGNHDGEEQWNDAKLKALDWRKKLFDMPNQSTSPDGGNPDGQYYAFSWGSDASNRGGVRFIVLHTTAFTGEAYPTSVDQWTLGQEQLKWFEQVLKSSEKDWTFACFHHVLGGWPSGSDETCKNYCYGRGPLFTARDYQDYASPDRVEQVKITQLGLDYGLNAFLYGHDHIFSERTIANGLNNKGMLGVCVGSTKFMGESTWWNGAYWKKHYGQYSKTPPDFWGPSGLTRLTLRASQARIDYIATGSTPHSNLPSTVRTGAVLSSKILINPPPTLASENSSLQFRAAEGREKPSSQILRIKNGGAQAMRFSLGKDKTWIDFSPGEGVSYGHWQEITVEADSTSLDEGTYEGNITVGSAEARNGSLTIPVSLTVDPPPVLAPTNLKGFRLGGMSLSPQQNVILLTWQNNPQNRRTNRFRVYLLDDRGSWSLIKEVGIGTPNFSFRKASRRRSYRFAVSAVDDKNREGEKASVLVS